MFWHFFSSDKEMRKFSDCINIADVKGNIINDETVWNITGQCLHMFKKG